MKKLTEDERFSFIANWIGRYGQHYENIMGMLGVDYKIFSDEYREKFSREILTSFYNHCKDPISYSNFMEKMVNRVRPEVEIDPESDRFWFWMITSVYRIDGWTDYKERKSHWRKEYKEMVRKIRS